jgi:transcriptional regulator GlxA family with amidase domain
VRIGTIARHARHRASARLFADHFVDRLHVALGGKVKEGETEEQSSVRAARLDAILGVITAQISNPGLNVAIVAAQLGITPRYVHLLLEQSGRTFMQHVLRERLERAAQLLDADKGQNRKIADIALEAGFADLSHFNRAFRRHFGDTPSNMRARNARRRP